MITVVSSVASFLVTRYFFGDRIAFVLCTVVLIHEFGHFAVARVGGFAQTWPVLLVPLGGFVAMDVDRALCRDRAEATAIAAGPIAGLLSGVLVAPFALATDWWLPSMFAFVTLVVNALNLLPVMPLDGGRLARILGLPHWSGLPFALATFFLDIATGLVLTALFVIASLGSEPSESGDYLSAAKRIAICGWLIAASLVGALLLTANLSQA